MTESKNNIISDRVFLGEIANEIGEAFINNPQLKSSMIKHTEKVIQKAEEYGQYLRAEWQKAKKAGLTQHDENKDGEKWFWWTAYTKDWSTGEHVYFDGSESMGVQFYIEVKPKTDPLSYLHSMIWGSVGEDYNGLELLDYQFVLLAIIHDAQNWQAGRKRIYFNPLNKKTLSDRLCLAVWHHLESKINSYIFRDVKNTIKTALQTIKASVEQKTKNCGDTYINAKHISLGDKAQHAGRDITTQEPNKKKGGWELVKKIGLFLSIIVSLIVIVGAYNKYIRKDKPAIERIKTPNLSGNSVDVNNLVFDTRPTADAIIEEIERLPVFEQKVAAENYIGRTFKWRLRFEVLVHEEGGMVYVACKASSVRGKVSFNINANAKENLKIKKIKKGKFLDVSGEIMGISLAREREPRISLKDVRLEFVD